MRDSPDRMPGLCRGGLERNAGPHGAIVVELSLHKPRDLAGKGHHEDAEAENGRKHQGWLIVERAHEPPAKGRSQGGETRQRRSRGQVAGPVRE